MASGRLRIDFCTIFLHILCLVMVVIADVEGGVVFTFKLDIGKKGMEGTGTIEKTHESNNMSLSSRSSSNMRPLNAPLRCNVAKKGTECNFIDTSCNVEIIKNRCSFECKELSRSMSCKDDLTIVTIYCQ